MKKTAALLLFLQIFFSCNGQNNKITKTAYVQKLEYGLKGAVKEVTSYTYRVENGKIPANTGNYMGEIMMTLDSLGNVITINELWNFDRTGTNKGNKSESLSRFFGKGKELSLKKTIRIGDGDFNEIDYKYVWSDDYNYTILSPENDNYSTITTLDKEYRLIKSVFKEGDTIQLIEEFEIISKNNKTQEIKIKTTQNWEGKKTLSYLIQVVQEYDKFGNPTIIYEYNDLNKQKLENVLYKEYKYYN